MARVARFKPKTVIHPLDFDRRQRPADGSGSSVSFVMAVGVVALMLGGLVMHATAKPAVQSPSATITKTISG